MLKEVTPARESEKTLVGGLLLDPTKFVIVKDMLCINDFFDEKLGYIFRSICEVHYKRGSFDIAMVSDHGGHNIHTLTALAQECPSTANLKAHADIIREKSVQKQLIAVAREVGNPDLLPLDEDEMAADFAAFTYVIQPSFSGDEINLILVCVHNESNINTNAQINPLELLNGGHGYLFGLMNQLTMIMKSKPRRTLADLHCSE